MPFLDTRSRVLVTGANGWFGRSVIKILCELSANVLATSRRPTRLNFYGIDIPVIEWDQARVVEFAPTVVIDCAFVTKERTEEFSTAAYLAINRGLAERAIWLAGLPSVERLVGFSSGASVTDAAHPYGLVKKEYEIGLELIAQSRTDLSVVIARAWSVSGHLVTKPRMFAFSDFILQSLTGDIQINSEGLVYRRYVAVEDLLKLSMLLTAKPGYRILDSGGELLELNDLAEKIARCVNPQAKIIRKLIPGTVPNVYYNDNSSWSEACHETSFSPLTTEQQIALVAAELDVKS